MDTVYVDSDEGRIHPQKADCGAYRFSFRRPGRKGRWQPSSAPLHNGDEVYLYCHSLGLGPYPNIEAPPDKASQAFCKQDSDEIRFGLNVDADGIAALTTKGWTPAVFTVEFVQ